MIKTLNKIRAAFSKKFKSSKARFSTFQLPSCSHLQRLLSFLLFKMLIALVGPTCSGKYEIAKYLIVHHHFRPAFLLDATSSKDHNDELLALCHGSSHNDGQVYDFTSTQSLLEHSTAHWRDNIVTMDLKTRAEIEIGFDKRPFFLLIGVDAPVTVRWKREVKRCVNLIHIRYV